MLAGRLVSSPGSNDNETHPCYEHDTAEDWREGDGLPAFVADLNRSYIDILFLAGEAEATGCEANDAEDDEQTSDDRCGFHAGTAFQIDRMNSTLWDAVMISSRCTQLALAELLDMLDLNGG